MELDFNGLEFKVGKTIISCGKTALPGRIETVEFFLWFKSVRAAVTQNPDCASAMVDERRYRQLLYLSGLRIGHPIIKIYIKHCRVLADVDLGDRFMLSNIAPKQ